MSSVSCHSNSVILFLTDIGAQRLMVLDFGFILIFCSGFINFVGFIYFYFLIKKQNKSYNVLK